MNGRGFSKSRPARQQGTGSFQGKQPEGFISSSGHRKLGFSLGEIRELLALRMRPGTKREHIRARADAKIADIEQKIQTLEAMKKTLRKLTERCDSCGPLSECPILESLDEEVSR